MLCPHCNAEMLPGWRVCHRCRRRLRAEERWGTAACRDPTPPTPSFVYVAPQTPARRSPRGLIVAAALVAVGSAALAAGGWVLLERQRRGLERSEALAVARLQTVVEAQMRYAMVNGAAFDALPCLAAPGRCLPGVPKGHAAFVAPEVIAPRAQEGYRLAFHPGPPPHGTRDPARHSASSLASFALVATPAEPGPADGRTFCADSTGRLCVIESPDAGALSDAVCPLLCADLGRTPPAVRP